MKGSKSCGNEEEQKSMYLENNNDQNVLFGVSHL